MLDNGGPPGADGPASSLTFYHLHRLLKKWVVRLDKKGETLVHVFA